MCVIVHAKKLNLLRFVENKPIVLMHTKCNLVVDSNCRNCRSMKLNPNIVLVVRYHNSLVLVEFQRKVFSRHPSHHATVIFCSNSIHHSLLLSAHSTYTTFIGISFAILFIAFGSIENASCSLPPSGS